MSEKCANGCAFRASSTPGWSFCAKCGAGHPTVGAMELSRPLDNLSAADLDVLDECLFRVATSHASTFHEGKAACTLIGTVAKERAARSEGGS